MAACIAYVVCKCVVEAQTKAKQNEKKVKQNNSILKVNNTHMYLTRWCGENSAYRGEEKCNVQHD